MLLFLALVRNDSWDMSFRIAVVASIDDDSLEVEVGGVWMVGGVAFWVLELPASPRFPVLLLPAAAEAV